MLSFIEILKAILFGIVEGITEWLPVSSTGHMILLNEFVHMNVSEEFWDMFLVVIQLGAILAVVLLFWKQIWPFNFTGRSKTNGIVKKDIMKMWFKIIVACIPAAVVGLLFDDILEKYLYNPITVAVMLILFGIGFILVENGHKGKRARVRSLAQLTYKDGDYHRSVPADCGNLSRNLPFRSNHSGRPDDRRFQNRCSRVHVLSGDPGYAGGEPVKGDPLRLCFFNGGGSDPAGWHGNCFYCIRACDSLPDGLHQKT